MIRNRSLKMESPMETIPWWNLFFDQNGWFNVSLRSTLKNDWKSPFPSIWNWLFRVDISEIRRVLLALPLSLHPSVQPFLPGLHLYWAKSFETQPGRSLGHQLGEISSLFGAAWWVYRDYKGISYIYENLSSKGPPPNHQFWNYHLLGCPVGS